MWVVCVGVLLGCGEEAPPSPPPDPFAPPVTAEADFARAALEIGRTTLAVATRQAVPPSTRCVCAGRELANAQVLEQTAKLGGRLSYINLAAQASTEAVSRGAGFATKFPETVGFGLRARQYMLMPGCPAPKRFRADLAAALHVSENAVGFANIGPDARMDPYNCTQNRPYLTRQGPFAPRRPADARARAVALTGPCRDIL